MLYDAQSLNPSWMDGKVWDLGHQRQLTVDLRLQIGLSHDDYVIHSGFGGVTNGHHILFSMRESCNIATPAERYTTSYEKDHLRVP